MFVVFNANHYLGPASRAGAAKSMYAAAMQPKRAADHNLPFAEEDLRALAGSALLREPSAANEPHVSSKAPSDFDLDPERDQELLRLVSRQSLRPAAVLVPIVLRAELTVLLTARADHLPSHAGQISFPGGKTDPGDASPLHTALREAEEEIGLDPMLVEPLGYLDCYRTGTGFCITPVVGAVQPRFTLAPDPREVSAVFEVPLAFLMDADNHQRHTRTLAGRLRHFHAMPFGDRFIWGATAGIIKALHTRMFGA